MREFAQPGPSYPLPILDAPDPLWQELASEPYRFFDSDFRDPTATEGMDPRLARVVLSLRGRCGGKA